MHKHLNIGITNNKETIQNLEVMQTKGEKRQNFDPPYVTPLGLKNYWFLEVSTRSLFKALKSELHNFNHNSPWIKATP